MNRGNQRPDFTTPPHQRALIALQPSWMRGARARLAALRRIWAVQPNAVSLRCWRWLTAGDGPPWQGAQDG